MITINRLLAVLALLGTGFCTAAYGSVIHAADGFDPADTSSTVSGGVNKQLSNMKSPFGSLGSSNTGFAAWEKFTQKSTENPDDPDDPIVNATFSNMAKQYWAGGIGLNVSLSQGNANSKVAKETSNFGYQQINGIDYYGRLTGELDFTISGSADQDINSLVLQIKHSPYFNSAGELVSPFAAELSFDGQSIAAVGVKESESQNFSDPIGINMRTLVYEYRWDNLNVSALSSFSISFISAALMSGEVAPMGLSVDTIALYAYAVPEPAAYALLMIAGTALVAIRRRRHSRS